MKTNPTIPTALYECGSLTHFIFKQSNPCFSCKVGEKFALVDGSGDVLTSIVKDRFEVVVPTPFRVGIKQEQLHLMAPALVTEFVQAQGFDLTSEELEALALSQQPCDHDGMHHLALIVTELPL